MEKNQVMQALNCNVNDSFNLQDSSFDRANLLKQGMDTNNYSCWDLIK